MRILILYLLLLLSSCNMGRQYAKYRFGGKTGESNSVIANDSQNEITSAEPEFKMEEIKNQDNLVISEMKINVETKIVSNEKINANQDSIPKQDSSFVMDDELVFAYATAGVNGLAAFFGFLTFTSPNAIWVAAPLYIFAGLASLIGIGAFIISLIRFSQGKIDPRNKKYYWIWILVFAISILLAVQPLLMFF